MSLFTNSAVFLSFPHLSISPSGFWCTVHHQRTEISVRPFMVYLNAMVGTYAATMLGMFYAPGIDPCLSRIFQMIQI